MATHELSLKLDQGMLSEINWVADSSAVAAEGVKAAGEIGKTVLESEIEAAKAQQTKQDTAASGLLTQIAAAEVEVAQAQAQNDLLLVDPAASADDRRKAAITLAQAKAKLDELEAQCKAIKCRAPARLGGGNRPLAGNVPVGPSRGQFGNYEPARYQVAGPVMFRVVPDGDAVKLVPIRTGIQEQSVYEVFSVVSAGATGGSPSEPAKPVVTVTPVDLGEITVGPVAQEVKLTTSEEIDAHVGYTFFDLGAKQPLTDAARPSVTYDNSKTLVVKFSNATPPGKYEMRLTLFVPKKPTEMLGQVSIPVRVR